MELIGFIGTYDKKDLLLNIGKILTNLGKRVLIVDSTLMQRLKYIVPNVSNGNSKAYISEYLGVDVALGFVNINGLMQYLGTNELPYDYVFIDTDNIQTIASFGVHRLQKKFFVTSYEQFELRRTVEIFKNINQPLNMTKVVLSYDVTDRQAYYLSNLMEQTLVKFNEQEVIFADNAMDRKAMLENQLVNELSLKHYSNTYKNSIEYLTALITEGSIEQGIIKREIKKM